MEENMKNPYIYDCEKCSNKCSGVSKGTYIFEEDLAYSGLFENEILKTINTDRDFRAKKTTDKGYPDVEIFDEADRLVSYLEIKAQRRTFMSVNRLLPHSDLKPSETVALNLSDLLRYFSIYNKTKIPIILVWVVSNRPCILKGKQHLLFFQNVVVLREIYKKYRELRRFRRKSGSGDVVNGEHKGVVVNYHFSLNELRSDFSHKLLSPGRV